MPEREEILTISKVIDDDTGMYWVGEIDGSWQKHTLDEYLSAHGEKGKSELINHLAYLQYQVVDAWRERNNETDCATLNSTPQSI